MYLKESDLICQCLSGIQLYIYDFVFISILLFCMFVECFLFFVVVFSVGWAVRSLFIYFVKHYLRLTI